MSNKTRIMLLSAVLGTIITAVFMTVHALTGGAWAISVPAALAAAAIARAAYWRSIGRMMNSNTVVTTDHGPDGRIEAIEVFWRPG